MDINKKNDQLGVVVIVVLQYLVNFPQIDLLLWYIQRLLWGIRRLFQKFMNAFFTNNVCLWHFDDLTCFYHYKL